MNEFIYGFAGGFAGGFSACLVFLYFVAVWNDFRKKDKEAKEAVARLNEQNDVFWQAYFIGLHTKMAADLSDTFNRAFEDARQRKGGKQDEN